MRTTFDIDDRLLSAAMRASGCKTKRATVEEGLRLLVRKKDYRAIMELRGTILLGWRFQRAAQGKNSDRHEGG